jgi:hypothetical protein
MSYPDIMYVRCPKSSRKVWLVKAVVWPEAHNDGKSEEIEIPQNSASANTGSTSINTLKVLCRIRIAKMECLL